MDNLEALLDRTESREQRSTLYNWVWASFQDTSRDELAVYLQTVCSLTSLEHLTILAITEQDQHTHVLSKLVEAFRLGLVKHYPALSWE
jgi:hypothetical protein